MNEAGPLIQRVTMPNGHFRFTSAVFHALTRPSPMCVCAENEVVLVSPGDIPPRAQQQQHQRYSEEHLAQMTGIGSASPELF